MFGPSFWRYLDQLVANCPIKVDRPKHSHHPRFPEVIYPLDYGYLDDTTSSDGAELDVWLGSEGREVVGVACCVDRYKRDVEIKVLLGCNSAEMGTIFHFHNDGDQAATLIKRPPTHDD